MQRTIRTVADESIRDADWIGFDMDHALVRYRLPALMKEVFGCLGEAAISVCGYDREALKGQPFEISFCGKGLIYESETGNLLKLRENGTVARAFHGTRPLSEDAITHQYGDRPWTGFDLLRARARHPTFLVFLTYFDMPGVLLAARMVDWVDIGNRARTMAGEENPYEQIRVDLITCFDNIFDNIKAFHNDRWGFFSSLMRDPDRFLYKRGGVRQWLERVRHDKGKRLFLATNSHIRFTEFLLSFTLGEDWRLLFDIVIVNSRKAGFFARIQPLYHLDAAGEMEGTIARHIGVSPIGSTASESRSNHHVFAQGNAVVMQTVADTLLWSDSGSCGLAMDSEGHVTSGAMVPPLVDSPLPEPSGAASDGGRPRLVSAVATELMDATAEESRPRGGLFEAEHEEEEADLLPRLGPGLVSATTPLPLTRDLFGSRRHARIAYVGDSLHGDVVAAREHMGWMTVAIVEELEERVPPRPWPSSWAAHTRRKRHEEEGGGAVHWSEGPWGSFWSDGHEGVSYFGALMGSHAVYMTTDVAALADWC